ASKKRKRNLTSDVWDDFEIVYDDGKEKAKCKECGQKYVYNSKKGGTSTLSRHKYPRREMRDVGKILLSSKNGQVSTRSRKIDQTNFREYDVVLIVARNLPFNFVGWPEFRNLCNYLNDDVKSLSRNTSKANIRKVHKIYKEVIRERLNEDILGFDSSNIMRQ
ncbi:hypothetical protein MKX01_012112, partial [Papaver californicum]